MESRLTPVSVEIERLSVDGDGIAMVGRRTVVVPHVLPGERVSVRVRSGSDGRLEGEVIEVLSASPHRITPRCRHFGPCGGCSWQHVEYGEQLRLKQAILQALIDETTGQHAPRVAPVVPSPASPSGSTPWGYRNKVSFAFGPGEGRHALVMGHHRRGSRRVLPVTECPVHAETGNRLAFALRDALAARRISGATADAGAGIARHVVVRVAESSGEWLATLVVTRNVKELKGVTARFLSAAAREARPGGFHLNEHDRDDPFLFGPDTLRLHGLARVREDVADATFLVEPDAFFQTNVRVAGDMVRHVLAALPAAGFARVLDLYAGVGLFALPLALSGATVTAVEENRRAVAGAEAARRHNGVSASRLSVVAGRVEDALGRLTPRTATRPYDAVVLDPPRQDCPPPVLDEIVRHLQPRRLVYVSCNPVALAHDLRTVLAAGYRAEAVVPFDMFPHTAHIESIATLSKA